MYEQISIQGTVDVNVQNSSWSEKLPKKSAKMAAYILFRTYEYKKNTNQKQSTETYIAGDYEQKCLKNPLEYSIASEWLLRHNLAISTTGFGNKLYPYVIASSAGENIAENSTEKKFYNSIVEKKGITERLAWLVIIISTLASVAQIISIVHDLIKVKPSS